LAEMGLSVLATGLSKGVKTSGVGSERTLPYWPPSENHREERKGPLHGQTRGPGRRACYTSVWQSCPGPRQL
jgi:hypothetical protein